MLQLSFHQTKSEQMVRAAATVLFNALIKARYQVVPLAELTKEVQYGFTASASPEPVGPKFVRITDLKDGQIQWDSVPYCECSQPDKYLLHPGDILFARTGATTGKTHLVQQTRHAVFASYLIRVTPNKERLLPEYLYSFFQSDLYWSQIIEEKQGSAQPNVNGNKLLKIQVPVMDFPLQSAINVFLNVVRSRQYGSTEELPQLPEPLAEQRRIVGRIEALAGKVEEARRLRDAAAGETELLLASKLKAVRSNLLEGSYKTNKIGNIAQVTSGGTPSRNNSLFWDGGTIPWIKTGELLDGDIDRAEECITSEGLNNSSAKLFPMNTILVALYGQGQTRGRTGRLLIEATTNQACCAILPTPTVLEPRYTQYWLRSLYYEMREQSHGGAQPNWNGGMIKAIEIALPSLEEQRSIVNYLDGLQSKTKQLQDFQTSTQKELDGLLPSLLDKAFKGEL